MEKITWIEIQDFIGKPLWEDVEKKWRILEGYRQSSDSKRVTFTDCNNWENFNGLELYKQEINNENNLSKDEK